MNEEHKIEIENIIAEFKKDANGRLYSDNFDRLIEDHNLRFLISKMLIDDLKLVEKVDSQILRLNIKGMGIYLV